MQVEKIIEKYIDDTHAILLCDDKGVVLHYSSHAKQLMHTLAFSTPQQFLPDDHLAFAHKVAEDARRSRNPHPLVVDEVKRNGTCIEYTYITKLNYVVVECHDVTEARKKEEELVQRALYDQVTGIPNRMYFLEEIEKEIVKAENDSTYIFGMTFLDLNDFKQMNDLHGHGFGDEYLKTFAKLLTQAVGEEHATFRYAGDEFIVITRNTRSYEKMSLVLKRIASLGEEPYTIEDKIISFAASVGSVLYRKGMTAKDMLDASDKAMYESKKRKNVEAFPYTFAA